MFKNNLQEFFIVCSNHFSKIWKYDKIGQSNTPSIFRDLEIKWSKVNCLIEQQISQMNRNWLIYTGFNSSAILWIIQTCHLTNFEAK